jgi:hypothetical protein
MLRTGWQSQDFQVENRECMKSVKCMAGRILNVGADAFVCPAEPERSEGEAYQALACPTKWAFLHSV